MSSSRREQGKKRGPAGRGEAGILQPLGDPDDIQRGSSFFVEVDRSTEDRKQFQRKVRGYLAYWESGAYLKRYQSKSMTALTVVAAETSRRVSQLKAWTEGQAHLGRRDTFVDLFWFADLAAATPEIILTDPIWHVAGNSEQHQLVE